MASIERRLKRLKEQMPAAWEAVPEPWPLEDQLEAVLDALQIHAWGRSVYQATDREIALLERVEDLPEEVRRLYERMDPARQPRREHQLYESWESNKRWRELSQKRLAWHREHGWDKPTPEYLLPGEGANGSGFLLESRPSPTASPGARLRPAGALSCAQARGVGE